MAIIKYNFILCLFASLIALAVSKDVHVQIGGDNSDFNVTSVPLGDLESKAYFPKNGDVIRTVIDEDGKVLFAAGERSVTLVFVNVDAQNNPSFTAVTFDGKFEHLIYRFKENGQWVSAVNGFQFFRHVLKDKVNPESKNFTYFPLDLAKLASNEYLQLEYEHKNDNYEVLFFDSKVRGNVVNEVKFGNETLLANQGDKLASASIKLFTRGEEKLVVLILTHKDGKVDVSSFKLENGKWHEHNSVLLVGDGTEDDAFYQAQFVYT